MRATPGTKIRPARLRRGAMPPGIWSPLRRSAPSARRRCPPAGAVRLRARSGTGCRSWSVVAAVSGGHAWMRHAVRRRSADLVATGEALSQEAADARCAWRPTRPRSKGGDVPAEGQRAVQRHARRALADRQGVRSETGGARGSPLRHAKFDRPLRRAARDRPPARWRRALASHGGMPRGRQSAVRAMLEAPRRPGPARRPGRRRRCRDKSRAPCGVQISEAGLPARRQRMRHRRQQRQREHREIASQHERRSCAVVKVGRHEVYPRWPGAAQPEPGPARSEAVRQRHAKPCCDSPGCTCVSATPSGGSPGRRDS